MSNEAEQTDSGENNNRTLITYICPYCGERTNGIAQCIFSFEAEECESYTPVQS